MFWCDTCDTYLSPLAPDEMQVGVIYSFDLSNVWTAVYYDDENECDDVKTFCCQVCKWEYEAIHQPTHYDFKD